MELIGSVKYVAGKGMSNRLIFIGEAPGEMEDRYGEPFVGKSGSVLNRWIAYLGMKREEVYITNVVKVRPNNNRTPTEEEVHSWLPLLQQEIASISPKWIVSLGKTAETALKYVGYPNLIVLYHPAYILRNPSAEEIVIKRLDLLKEKLKEIK